MAAILTNGVLKIHTAPIFQPPLVAPSETQRCRKPTSAKLAPQTSHRPNIFRTQKNRAVMSFQGGPVPGPIFYYHSLSPLRG